MGEAREASRNFVSMPGNFRFNFTFPVMWDGGRVFNLGVK